MKNLLVSFDENTGNLYLGAFNILSLVHSSPQFNAAMSQPEVKTQTVTVADLVELKKAGYLTEDIVQLKREELL